MRGLVLTLALVFVPAPSALAQAGVSYQIPPDNPFVGRPGAAPEVYAYGLRNPFRFSFDRETGALLIGDVGGGSREEVDWIDARAAGGANFGWACREGTGSGPKAGTGECPAQAFVEPLFDYPTPSPGAVIGGYVVRDPALTGLRGRYLFADHYTGDIHSLRLDPAAPDDRTTGINIDRIGGFGEDASGRLYVADLNGDQVLRLTGGATPGTLGTAPAGAYTAPVAIAPEPANPDRLFVAEIAGRVLLGGTQFADVASFPDGLAVEGERGLLSVVAAPDYPTSGKVYVYYTDLGGDIRIDEVRRSLSNPAVADPATRRTLLAIEHSNEGNHNGGTLQFGRDGCLWITTGDGGGQADQHGNAQNLSTLLGKVLRIDPDPPGVGGSVCRQPDMETPPPPGDTTAPALTTRVPRRQHVLRLRGAVAYARCDEPCTLAAGGFLRTDRRTYRLRRISRPVRPSRRARVKVRLTRGAARALRRRLRAGGRRSRVRVGLRARDAAGNRSRLARATVRVRRLRPARRHRARGRRAPRRSP
jgi:glucose/arabinose dehydrogenase